MVWAAIEANAPWFAYILSILGGAALLLGRHAVVRAIAHSWRPLGLGRAAQREGLQRVWSIGMTVIGTGWLLLGVVGASLKLVQ